jgi:hypothetical protein
MVMVVSEERTLGQDALYYFPRWAAVGLAAVILFGGAFLTPHADDVLPEMSRVHTMLSRIALGVGYGLLGGGIFVALQRVWNLQANAAKWWANIFAAGIITVVVFFNVSARHFHFGSHQNDTRGSDELQRILANTTRSAEPQTVARSREARKQVSALIANAHSDADKEQIALSVFYGFYFLNTTVRSGYCQLKGVPIPAFVAAFKMLNKEPHELALKGLHKYDDTEDHVYTQLAPEMYKFNAENLEDVAAHDGLTVAEECQCLQDNPIAQASQLSFSRLQSDAMPFLRSAAR